MAFAPEKLDENRISELAEKIANSYMVGKAISSVEEYINTYMDVYDASKQIIAKREQDKINTEKNINVEQLMNEAVMEEDYESTYPHIGSFFR